MSIKKIIIVFRKELLDLFRDKRTIITSIVVPIILYPLMMIGFNSLMIRQTIKLQEQQVIIYVNDEADNIYSHQIIEEFYEREQIQLYQSTNHYQELFNDRIIQAIVNIEHVAGDNGYPYLDISITYNSVDENSQQAFSNVYRALQDIEHDLIKGRLQGVKISEDILKVFDVRDDDKASESQALGLILSKILPYFLILISISGCAVAAVDLVAGEKERKTLETILVSAALRTELVIGKYLAVITISLITIVLNLASIFFSFRHIMSQAAAEAVVIEIPVANILYIFILMFPMIIFFASLLLSLSTYSRNMKEGYSYTQPIMIVAMLFSLISTLPAIENSFMLSLIPIINVSLNIRDILIGDINYYLFMTTFISTLVLVVLGIFLSIKLFTNESVLFRTSEEGSMFKNNKDGKWALNPNFAILFFLLILMLFYYLGISWQIQDIETGLIKTLVLLVLMPTLILLKLGKLSFKKVLRLNPTNPLNFIIIIAATLPLFILVTLLGQLINIVFPIPAEHIEAFQNIFFLEGRTYWYLLFLIAFLPGICEEVMFRGYFIKVFEKKGITQAIIISAVLFGILHLDIYRLIPITILGIWMGYIVIKTNSLYIPIVAHIANNALAISIAKYGDKMPGIEYFIIDDNLAWWLAIPSLIILIILIKQFQKVNDPKDHNNVLSP